MIEQRAAELAGKTAGMAEKTAVGTAIGTAGMGAAKTFCGILLSDWALMVGIACTALSFVYSMYCRNRAERREEERMRYDRERARREGIEVQDVQ